MGKFKLSRSNQILLAMFGALLLLMAYMLSNSQELHEAETIRVEVMVFLKYLLIFTLICILLYRTLHPVLEEEEKIKLELQQKTKDLKAANKTIQEKVRQLNILNQMLDMKVDQRTATLEKTNKDLNTLLYRLSHDVMGPMASIKGMTNIALMETRGEEADMMFSRIDESNEKLMHFVRKINQVYEIKNREIKYTRFSVAGFIKQKLSDYQDRDELKPVRVELELEEGLDVNTDNFLLDIAVEELVRNAVAFYDARKDKNTLVVRSRLGQHKKLARIEFEDNGLGLNPESREEIFEMFEKDSMYPAGLGLGLYLVKEAMTKIKGHVRLMPSDKGNTLIELSFPIDSVV